MRIWCDIYKCSTLRWKKHILCPYLVLVKLQPSSPQTSFDALYLKIVWRKLGNKYFFEQEVKHWAAAVVAAAPAQELGLLHEARPWPQAGQAVLVAFHFFC